MELIVSGNEKNITVRIAGPLVAENCSALREYVLELSLSGRNHIELDFSKVSALDTAGMGMLLLLKAAVSRRGGTLKVLAPRSEILDSLKAMRIAEALGIAESSL